MPRQLPRLPSQSRLQARQLDLSICRGSSRGKCLRHLAQLPTLENRRIYLKLCTLFKITHGLFPFAYDVFTPHPNRRHYNHRSRLYYLCYNDLPLLCQPFAHTNSFQSSFVPSTIAIWNHLPHDALTAHSFFSFKSRISPIFM